jgi:predicted  nucleic acid-binding Zn-ribbon protein
MPNKCTKCGKVHPDDADYLLKGCDKCGSKFFFYVSEAAMEKLDRELEKLTPSEVDEIERDIREIVPKVRKGDTVIFDLEAIRVIKPGKYMIDVTRLFQQKPIVIRLGAGKYELDLSVLLTKFRRPKPGA